MGVGWGGLEQLHTHTINANIPVMEETKHLSLLKLNLMD